MVILKSHEAMQCFCSWVDASSVPSLSAMFLALRVIVKSISCFFYCMWLNMRILHAYHDDSDREVMVQGGVVPIQGCWFVLLWYMSILMAHMFMI